MKRKSHIFLGKLLAENYLQNVSGINKKAFLFGCIQPDQNPLTYLKGSIRYQQLRGHNYKNAKRFMLRTANRLEQRNSFNAWDYYTLGKLIHYTTDAFTYAHNSFFKMDLHNHRVYEACLQDVFLACEFEFPEFELSFGNSSAEIIQWIHRIYICQPCTMESDAQFAFLTSCMIMCNILKMCHALPDQ